MTSFCFSFEFHIGPYFYGLIFIPLLSDSGGEILIALKNMVF
jgi:hypothetical protein